MIGIIGAMDEEIALLKEEISSLTEITVAQMKFYTGQILNQDIVLLQCGIGKVNAALGTTIMHERFKPKYIINTGSAGGFSTNLSIGDAVISDKVTQHDVNVTAFGYVYGQVPGLPESFTASPLLIKRAKQAIEKIGLSYEIGLIATGDQFMNDSKHVEIVRKRFPEMIASDMEAGAIAQVCHQYDTPFVITRALSDIAGKESNISFDEFLETAATNAARLILTMIKLDN